MRSCGHGQRLDVRCNARLRRADRVRGRTRRTPASYGTTAQRLEGAINAVAASLQLDCEPWSNPTGMILTFSDPTRPAGESDTTRVIRLPPGDTDLAKLCEADRIAEEVMAGRLDLAAGHAALRALDRAPSRRWRAMQVLGFGLAAGSVGGTAAPAMAGHRRGGGNGPADRHAGTGRPSSVCKSRKPAKRWRHWWRASSRSRSRRSSRRSTSTP